MSRPSSTEQPDPRIPAFVELVAAEGGRLFREFPWRDTHDPYAILVSEVMLQQTQVTRVVPYFEEWMVAFPTLEALAAAPLEAVLRAWQGLGYNRRAVALKRCAEQVTETARDTGRPAELPDTLEVLVRLPGVGPATAAGVLAFGFGKTSAYLETNVRSVFLHELFADSIGVNDRDIMALVRQAAEHAAQVGITPRHWNYALLDYGAYLKRTVPNPSRRSAHHTRQSAFEGSRRQKRSRILRLVMDSPGITSHAVADSIGVDMREAEQLLDSMASEGLVRCTDGIWSV